MSKTKTTKRIHDDVLRIKDWLAGGREKLFRQHQSGSPGIQVCTQLTELLDTVVLEIFENALSQYGENVGSVSSRIALVPHGGYGRREMAPYSDIDLMLLHTQGSLSLISPLARHLVRDFSDVGIELGFSTRTIRQACQMSVRDPIIFTSLADARFLGGSVRFFKRFLRSFAKTTRRKSSALVKSVEESRRSERARYGETVYLLEPNIKRSPGGLRDLQLLRWIGFARYGEAVPAKLHRRGYLTGEDFRRLQRARDFLLRLRNEMHFNADSARDVLYRDEQMRIADAWGYQGRDGVLPVEQFMQDYFKYTSSVRQVVAHFVDGARWRHPTMRRLASLLTSHQVERDFRVGQVHIRATRRGLEKVRSNLADILRLMDLSGRYNCRIDHPTWRAIREAVLSRSDLVVDRAAADRFRSLLSQPNRLGKLLRRLHELRVLEKLVPGFDHARSLLQFNEYHKYTVDEHSLRAVEAATRLMTDDSILGRAYRELKDNQRFLLHLALLVHDLGKGYPRDHSEVGAEIALDVADNLFLSSQEKETLRFLVHRHLMLSHLAFRRDTSDESIVLEHSAEIGSPSMLRLIFILTCADLEAVGPGVMNQWKLDVLAKLYGRMMDHVSGGGEPTPAAEKRMADRKAELLQQVDKNSSSEWLESQIDALPVAYLEGPTSEDLVEDLNRLRPLEPGDAVAWGRYLPERKVVEYSIGVYERPKLGIFHRLTGALSSNGLEILSAEIHSLADGLCLDRFYVDDNDYRDQPPSDRIDAVTKSLVKSLKEPSSDPPSFRRTWQSDVKQHAVPLNKLPTKIRVDNSTSDRYTIIDVFTHDRQGLLYTIAQTLFELNISVASARIGTYLDQVVDVFYVTDSGGLKVEGEGNHQRIRSMLLKAIEAAPAND